MKASDKLWYGLDPERVESTFKDHREERERLEQMITRLERSKKWLRDDEVVLLELVRSGKGPADVCRVLGLRSRQAADKAINHVIRVAKFYCEHVAVVERSRGVIRDLLVERLTLAEISRKRGGSVKTAERDVADARECVDPDSGPATRKAVDEFLNLQNLGFFKKWRSKMAGEVWRDEFRQTIKMLVEKGVWYEWGGQSPFKRPFGVADCSGLVIEVLKKVGRLPDEFPDTNVRGLVKEFPRVAKPRPGDVMFYGRDLKTAGHIMFYLGPVVMTDVGVILFDALPGKLIHEHAVIGMCGGRRNMTVEYARYVGAGLWMKSSPRYRRDFLRFGKVS